jgi:molybdopterin-guanine dinucleotide biosynthesis protein A
MAVVILAGGEGKRIGGGKPLKLLGGKRLIDRSVEFARHWSDTCAVALRAPGQVQGTSLLSIIDEPGIGGPLAGLVAALRFAADCEGEAVLTIPADMPFLPQDLPLRLKAGLGSAAAALAGSGSYLHPVCGLWRVAALHALEPYVASGQRSLKGFAELVGFESVWWSDAPVDPFFNINSAEELAAAERLLQA